MQSQLLINGQLVTGQGTSLPVYNPATGEVILQVAQASLEQVDQAVLAADAAFAEWGQTTPKERADCLLKLANLIETGADAKAVLGDELVTVNGETEIRRGRQLRDGDVVELGGVSVRVAARRSPAE